MTYDRWKTTEPDTRLPERCTVCGHLLTEPCSPETCPFEQKPEGAYGPMCRDPKLCAGKGYCPRDPTCAD